MQLVDLFAEAVDAAAEKLQSASATLKCQVKVYRQDGTLVGEIDTVTYFDGHVKLWLDE